MADETAISPAMTGAASETPSIPASDSPPAATETQAGDAPTQSPAETPAPKDYAKLAKEDPDLAAHIKAEANRIAQINRNREAKAEAKRLAREAKQSHDAGEEDTAYAKALQVAERVASEPDDDDPDTTATRAFRQKADAVAPVLKRLSANPDYKAVYEREGKDAMGDRYRKDPEAFVDWMLDAIAEHRAEQKAKKAAPILADAMATSQVNQALAGHPTPITGASGGSRRVWTAQELAEMSQAEFERNKDAIFNLIPR